MKKRAFYTEWAYVLGIIILALGTALMERADFGVSMVVAPAYLLHLKISPALPFFSFGMAEYLLQLVILLLMMLVLRRAKASYLFSFVTAVVYGFALDGMMALVALVPGSGMALRAAFYLLGMLACSLGVALLFHTYIAPEVYELFVKELAGKLGAPIPRVKTIYDCISCLIAILLSFIFFGFGHFEGVKLGTIFCALVNGWIIGQCTKLLERRFEFRDGLKLRRLFQ
ncbi:MAG: hypothetical protein IJ466_08150 [Clostridia bacterium]|nr:hypothetical protein [Clostridia bacterium]